MAKEVLCKDHATVNPAHPVHVDVGPCPVVAGWSCRDWQRSAAGPPFGWAGLAVVGGRTRLRALALARVLGHGSGGGCGWPGLFGSMPRPTRAHGPHIFLGIACPRALGLSPNNTKLIGLAPDGVDVDAPLGRAWNGGPCTPWVALGHRIRRLRRPVLPPRASGRLVDAGTHGALDHQRLLRTARRGRKRLPSFARPLGRNPRCDGVGSANVVRDFGDPHGQLAAPQKCRRRFGLLDDPVGHGDGFDGLHRSIRHASRMRDDFASPRI